MNQTDKLSGVENAQGQDVGDGIFILKDSFTHDPDAWYVQVGARVSDGYDGAAPEAPLRASMTIGLRSSVPSAWTAGRRPRLCWPSFSPEPPTP